MWISHNFTNMRRYMWIKTRSGTPEEETGVLWKTNKQKSILKQKLWNSINKWYECQSWKSSCSKYSRRFSWKDAIKSKAKVLGDFATFNKLRTTHSCFYAKNDIYKYSWLTKRIRPRTLCEFSSRTGLQ